MYQQKITFFNIPSLCIHDVITRFTVIRCCSVEVEVQNEGMKSISQAVAVTALLEKFFATIAYDSLYVWSFELNTTIVRSQAFLLFSIVVESGRMTVPFLEGELQNTRYIIPFIFINNLKRIYM